MELQVAGLIRLDVRDGEEERDGLLDPAVHRPSLGAIGALGDAQLSLVETMHDFADRARVSSLQQRVVLDDCLDLRAQLRHARIRLSQLRITWVLHGAKHGTIGARVQHRIERPIGTAPLSDRPGSDGFLAVGERRHHGEPDEPRAGGSEVRTRDDEDPAIGEP